MEHADPWAESTGLEIAIIGMSGRFPGAASLDQFWQSLRDGIEGIRPFTDEELITRGVDPALLQQPNFVKAGAVLDDIDAFDAALFGFAPREAALMDPQHRLFLECAWQALEHAGCNWETYPGLIGVYAGTSLSTYLLFNLLGHPDITDGEDSFAVMIGNDKDFLSTRVSYYLDLKGPSLDLQTGCSTSLVAAHIACQSLLSYQCDVALAGGVSVNMPQRTGYLYQQGGIASPDGHCRAFDAEAQGTVFGSGVGMVVLKRLDDALADGDTIHAVIRGSAINNDGAAKIGYTAPSVDGQAEVIARAQALAGVAPEAISYIETHGTGTALGDPVEVTALTQVFQTSQQTPQSCALGSVKTNIGHLDAAAGVVGLIKTVLALRHQQIPPTLHFKRANPAIDFERGPFYVNNNLIPWPTQGLPRRAGVSSFGIGGTNAHLILEEAPATTPSSPSREWEVLPLSASTPSALATATANLRAFLQQHPDANLADVAYTLQTGRKRFAHRRSVVCQSVADAIDMLETLPRERVADAADEQTSRAVVFMFPGGGTQYVDMGLELHRTEPTFRAEINRCVQLLRPLLKLDLAELLYPTEARREEATQLLKRTSIGLPALFTVEYALARQWISWGLEPQALIGHSLGEYVAACLSGVFSLQDALRLVVLRGQLFEQIPPGGMMSVSLAEDELLPLLDEQLSIAAINARAQCVVAGPAAALDRLAETLQARDVQLRRLYIDVAAHSHMVTPILAPFGAFVETLHLSPPTIPFVSNVTGTWITPAEATDPAYWTRHLRQAVRFADGLVTVLADAQPALLEVGPGRALVTFARQLLSDPQYPVIASMRHPYDPPQDALHLVNAIGRLWLASVALDWTAYAGEARRQRVPLPTYPFERQRFWIAPPTAAKRTARALGKQPDLTQWGYLPSWQRSLTPAPAVTTPQRWLLLLDDHDLGTTLARHLEQAGHQVVQVRPGPAFRADGARYTLRPDVTADYQALLKALHATAQSPQQIVHLWSLTPPATDTPPGERCAQAQERGLYSLIGLAQALGQRPAAEPVGLTVVSNNVHSVIGAEALCPEQATVLGPCRVIAKEYPAITCRNLDIDLSSSSGWQAEALARQVIEEALAGTVEPLVAYRAGYRWTQVFVALPLTPPAERATGLRQRGVYLITGGLGGIGLVLARYLAETVQARLVLIARTALPPHEHWPELLEGGTAALQHKLREIRELEAAGAEVLAISADVTDPTQMDAAMRAATERFGAIHGVIHAAGVPTGGLIDLKTPEAVADVIAPKVTGTLVLDQLFAARPLDFLILCSSLSAIVGDIGQVDHTAANAFLDAFAVYAASRGRPTVAINWDTWQEVGQAVTATLPAELQAWRAEMLKHGILPSEGVELFRRIVARPMPQVIISTQELTGLLERASRMNVTDILAELQAAQRPASTSPVVSQEAFVPPGDTTQQALAAIWQQMLGVERVGALDNFFDLGGSSLIGLKVIAEIKRVLGVDLPMISLFESPTVSALAAHIQQQQAPTPQYDERSSRGARRRARAQQLGAAQEDIHV